MPDQAVCRWCGHSADRPISRPDWFCHVCKRWQHVMDCPCCGERVSVERVEMFLGRPVTAQDERLRTVKSEESNER